MYMLERKTAETQLTKPCYLKLGMDHKGQKTVAILLGGQLEVEIFFPKKNCRLGAFSFFMKCVKHVSCVFEA